MVAALLLAAALLTQGGAPARDPAQTLPPRVRAMLPSFPPPSRGDVSVAIRFSADTVYIGEQVEIVTATWFAGDLLSALRRLPRLSPPSLSGLWSAQSTMLPALTAQRVINGRVFNLYISHQTLFALDIETIVAPPAKVEFWVPASTSFFAPEEAKVLFSSSARLVVLPVPAHLKPGLGSGPTARGLSLLWRGPASGLSAGVPAPLELVIRGSGNITLWPEPDIVWPANVHVYPEPTEETERPGTALRGGEKRFRFSVVVDSVGVLTLPSIRYPYFDPVEREVHVTTAAGFALPVLPAPVATLTRTPSPVTDNLDVPIATLLVDRGAPLLWILGLLPLAAFAWSRRDRPRKTISVVATSADPEAELRRLLGTPVDAAPDRVIMALRQRGVPREEAEAVRQCLVAVARKRYGPDLSGAVPSPDLLLRVLARLRGLVTAAVMALLCIGGSLQAQGDAIARYRGGDYAGAERLFEEQAGATPAAPVVWRNLAAARLQLGDEVGTTAALIRALSLAPRDAESRALWARLSVLPPAVRELAPAIPVSRDEILLVGLVGWLITCVAWWRGRRRTTFVALVCGGVAMGLAFSRYMESRGPQVLLRAGSVLRVSPTGSAPVLGELPEWTRARVERHVPGWYLVRTDRGAAGWLPVTFGAALGSLPDEETL